MKNKEAIRQALEKELNGVTDRLTRLTMIEERLLEMRDLAQSVIDQDLTSHEIKEVNKQLNNLKEQISLLEGETDDYQH